MSNFRKSEPAKLHFSQRPANWQNEIEQRPFEGQRIEHLKWRISVSSGYRDFREVLSGHLIFEHGFESEAINPISFSKRS
jgi:hypothetical protein